ncbi:MAG: hypothetical protein R8M45_03615 [Ghiorsea sp.]
MIYGKTIEQKRVSDEIRDYKAVLEGIKKFAYIPVKLNCGRMLWLDTYYTYRLGRVFSYGLEVALGDSNITRYKEKQTIVLDGNDILVEPIMKKAKEYDINLTGAGYFYD